MSHFEKKQYTSTFHFFADAEAPGEVVMVSKPKLEKWKVSMGTSQKEWTLKRSWLTVVEDN